MAAWSPSLNCSTRSTEHERRTGLSPDAITTVKRRVSGPPFAGGPVASATLVGMAELDYDLVYDLVVAGGTAGGLSVAISSQRSGVQSVRLISSSNAVTFPELVRDNQLDIGYGERVEEVDGGPDGSILVRTNRHRYRARAVLLAR